MSGVTIYTGMLCGYCAAAKRLLEQKGVAFDEIDVTFNREARNDMAERAQGATSVPQIFIGTRHIGGCDELYALEESAELDTLLTGAEASGQQDAVE